MKGLAEDEPGMLEIFVSWNHLSGIKSSTRGADLMNLGEGRGESSAGGYSLCLGYKTSSSSSYTTTSCIFCVCKYVYI